MSELQQARFQMNLSRDAYGALRARLGRVTAMANRNVQNRAIIHHFKRQKGQVFSSLNRTRASLRRNMKKVERLLEEKAMLRASRSFPNPYRVGDAHPGKTVLLQEIARKLEY